MYSRALIGLLSLTLLGGCKSLSGSSEAVALSSEAEAKGKRARTQGELKQRSTEAHQALTTSEPLAPKPSTLATQAKQDRVAVLPLVNQTSNQVSQAEVGLLTEVVRNAAQRLPSSQYLVMRNEPITVLLPEGTSLEDCQGECELETGRLIGAHWLVTGSVVRFGKSLRVTLALFDTRKAQQISSKITRGSEVEDLEGPLQRDALLLLSALEPGLTQALPAQQARLGVWRY